MRRNAVGVESLNSRLSHNRRPANAQPHNLHPGLVSTPTACGIVCILEVRPAMAKEKPAEGTLGQAAKPLRRRCRRA